MFAVTRLFILGCLFLSPANPLRLKTFFTPLDVESLEHVKQRRLVGLPVDPADDADAGALKGLFGWTAPFRDEAVVEDAAFSAFLPAEKSLEELSVGDTWKVFDVPEAEPDVSGGGKVVSGGLTVESV